MSLIIVSRNIHHDYYMVQRYNFFANRHHYISMFFAAMLTTTMFALY